VLALVRERLTNERIASRLGITADTAKFHVSEIITKLGVSDRHQAAAWQPDVTEAGTQRWLAGLAPLLWVKRLPFAWLPKAAAVAALAAAAAGVAMLTWGVLSTSSDAVTTTGCTADQPVGNAPPCAPGAAQAGAGPGAISAIDAGEAYTCALKDGGVWCWGADGTTGSSVPVAVPGLTSGVSAISADNSCALKGGGVWCWGSNGISDSPVPVAVPGLTSGVTAISDGGGACAVKDGGAWCLDTNAQSPAFVSVSGLTGGVSAISGTCAVKDGGVWCWDEGNVAVAVSGLGSGVSAISAGTGHVCAVKDGGVLCWGSNFSRQLGNNGTDSPVPVAVSGLTSGVSAISAGGGYSCALKDGGVWCWGDNSIGQLGNNSTTDVCGLNFFPCSHLPVAVTGLASGVSAISAGRDHSCALKDDGAWCWGRNDAGQLGNNRPTHSDVPVAVSGLESSVTAIEGACALKHGGVWCWGANDAGQLGNNSITDSAVPVAVSGLGSGVSALEGSTHANFGFAASSTCALKAGGVWCWGANDAGQLGNNSTTNSVVPVAVAGLESGVSAISAGPCALKGDGLWCWGGTRRPANSSTTPSLVPVAVSGPAIHVSAPFQGDCELKDGGVWCSRFDEKTSSAVLVAVPGLESGVTAISESCALQRGGVWCWGWEVYGSSLLLPVVAVSGLASRVSAIGADGLQTCALKDGGVWCWSLNVGPKGALPVPSGAVPVAVSGLTSGVAAISADAGRTCALKEGGVWCWGDNSHGQLGNNSPADSPVPVAALFPGTNAGRIAAAPGGQASSTPPRAGDIAAGTDAQPSPSPAATDSADHRTAYALAGVAAAALAVVSAGVWAIWRRQRRT